MAQVEPMDIDSIESDFDNKENAFHHNNVLSRTPCTEKGYEELDVSELNMKLRYSVTPASSPMSKSLTGPCLDNRNCNSEDYLNNTVAAENSNLTRSLNSTLTKPEGLSKSKVLPLQILSTEPIVDGNSNLSIHRLIDSTNNNILISVDNANDADENLSLPSTCSSVPETPEATTPTKEIPKPESSPIMRGLKSVLSMFRPSQSPILPEDKTIKQEILSPDGGNQSEAENVQVSTPVATHKQRDANSSKRSSPLKESLVFNEDLERELQWKDETTILFKDEKIPIHKLLFMNPLPDIPKVNKPNGNTVEHMDISCDESILVDKTNIEPIDQSAKTEQQITCESDNEFLDCETTFSKNDRDVTDHKLVMESENITFDLSKHAEVSKVINSECELAENTVPVIPGNTTNQALSMSDFAPILDRNNANIIGATMNLLSSESNGLDVVSFNNQVNKSESSDIPLPVADEAIKDDGLLNSFESKSEAEFNSTNDLTASENLACKEMSDYENRDGSINNLSDSCIETLNNINNLSDRTNETVHILQTRDKIELVDEEVVTYNDVTKDYPTSDNRDTNKGTVDIIGSVPNNDKANVNDKFDCSQSVAVELNTDLSSNKHNMPVADGEMPLTNKITIGAAENSNDVECVLEGHHEIENMCTTHINTDKENIPIPRDSDMPKGNTDFNSIASNSNIVENNFNYDPKIIDDLPIKQTTKDDDTFKQINSEMPQDDKNLSVIAIDSNIADIDDENKIIEDMSTTCTTIAEVDMPIATTILPPDTYMTNPSNVQNVQLNLNDDLTTNIDYNPRVIERNSTQKYNDDNIKHALERDKESSSQLSSKYDVSEVDDKMLIKANTDLVMNTISDNDHTVSELLLGNHSVSSTSPLEIPLPDDDAGQNILETNSEIEKKCDVNTITIEKSGKDTIMDVDSNLVLDCTKINEEKLSLNAFEENDSMSILNIENERNFETTNMEKEVNNTQICIIQTPHTTEAGAIKVNSEIIEQDKVIFDIPITEEISSKDMTEGIYQNIESGATELQMNENTKTYINEKAPSHNEEISVNTETNLLNTDNTIESSDKFKEIDQLKTVENENSNLEKTVDEIDEEILTSANNSPYVSVTDLDIVSGKTFKDHEEETENPFTTNTKIACSPPESPKIVSKGYNFNFDDIDDPFATKTKIRMSPTPDVPNLSSDTISKETKSKQESPKKVNRRKLQSDKKKSVQKKNINSTFSEKLKVKESTPEKLINSATNVSQNKTFINTSVSPAKENTLECKPDNCVAMVPQNDNEHDVLDATSNLVTSSGDQVSPTLAKQETQPQNTEVKRLEQTLVISTEKSTSSSEQYFSLGTSSGESSGLMNRSKNVFNIPEIDDVNFNPFATKSKMRASPPPVENISSLEVNEDVSKSALIVDQHCVNNNTKNIDTEVTFTKKITSDSSPNSSNATCSSKHSNGVDVTAKEILTEDEDTLEGPFLEVDNLRDIQIQNNVEIEADMMNFDATPQQDKDENLENDELFIDADAFEFLLNQNKSTTVLDSGKESLFLKFDPLFANRVSSDGILAAFSKIQKRQSTPKKLTKLSQKDSTSTEKPLAGPSNINENCGPIEEFSEDLSSTMTKPMMVVNPAVSSIISHKKTATPKLNRRSLTFTSPAMAVIDRLLSLSGNTSHLEHDASIPQMGREHSETDLAITQLREMLAEKEINVHSLRSECKELKNRLTALEVQVRGLETESSERLSKINDLNERLSEKTKINKSMATVVEEYERTIASLIAETELDKKRNAEERMRLIKERDEQTAHLTSMEVSFSDLHSKYEKSKQIILSCKANEDIYKKSIKEFQDNFSKMQSNYELLKQHATSKLNHANQELEKINRSHEAEVLKMNAMIKRKELHITSLEETLAHKTKANEELTAICDELINKVG